MPKFDITDNKIRARQRDPEEFEKDSFKTISLTSGVKAVVGIPKDSESTEIQSVLFDKERFSESAAEEWLESHFSKVDDALDLENQKMGLFNDGEDSEFEFIDATELYDIVAELEDRIEMLELKLLEAKAPVKYGRFF